MDNPTIEDFEEHFNEILYIAAKKLGYSGKLPKAEKKRIKLEAVKKLQVEYMDCPEIFESLQKIADRLEGNLENA